MFEARTNEWRQTCLQALGEQEPTRPMALLETNYVMTHHDVLAALQGLLTKSNYQNNVRFSIDPVFTCGGSFPRGAGNRLEEKDAVREVS